MNTAVSNMTVLHAPRALVGELMRREPLLTRFGLVLWLLAIPTLMALSVDERTLRDVSVWLKPFKFMVSVGLFALTTAWFVGLLPQARRTSWPVRGIVATIVAAGSFEIGYITLQAALGSASHYNVGDPLHAALYSLMGLGAVALVATQPVLAVQIARHGRLDAGRHWRLAVIAGLWLTAILGGISGGLLSGLQPPSGAGLPLVGWQLRGDLRPAHFIGLHAHQLLPLAALACGGLAPARARGVVIGSIVVLVAGWGLAMAVGLSSSPPLQ